MYDYGTMTYDHRSSDDVRAWPLDTPRSRVLTALLWLAKVVLVAVAIVAVAWESLT